MKPLELFGTLALALLSGSALGQPAEQVGSKHRESYSVYAQIDFPDEVLFGDTHVHTVYSPDAGMAGTTITPDQAYRFAQGDTVTSSTGIPVRLGRPLDWLVIADHAENLGLPVAILNQDPSLMANDWGREMAKLFAQGTADAARQAIDRYQQVLNDLDDPLEETDFSKNSWIQIIDAAERHNAPGHFTAFIGFEWTTAPGGANLHRNVIFRDDKSFASQIVPISAYDTEDPEVLWDWMEKYETDTGGRLLAIPHNGNLSNGLMFDDVTLSGGPLTSEYAQRRSRFEPLYEVTQTKGDGEAHPLLSPADEFADFETWDKGSFGPQAKTPDMLPREYAREAYKRGLAYEKTLGANPFKFGMVGSTDTHTGLSTAQEDNFFGKIAVLEPTADPIRFNEPVIGRLSEDDNKILAWQANAAGIAAVWARDNTREAIFNAMERREVYATTGTRLRVRLFGGWSFDEADLFRSNFAQHGYENGVPMGGDLSGADDDESPRFLIQALRDPDGANLDRVQIIKGWEDSAGELHEKIYDIACSDDREINRQNRCQGLVGNTVDVAAASYSNSIGSVALQAHWQDPDFDRGQYAFYYVRVLEIPTPRWTVYDARFFGVDLKEDDPRSIQERAYTTPIWYSPSEI